MSTNITKKPWTVMVYMAGDNNLGERRGNVGTKMPVFFLTGALHGLSLMFSV